MILVACKPRQKTWSMGCCALESGDAVLAIPFRNLTNCAAQPFRWSQQEELQMKPDQAYFTTLPLRAAA